MEKDKEEASVVKVSAGQVGPYTIQEQQLFSTKSITAASTDNVSSEGSFRQKTRM